MGKIIEFPELEENVLTCKCGGQSFLVIVSADETRVIGFECLTCANKEYILDA